MTALFGATLLTPHWVWSDRRDWVGGTLLGFFPKRADAILGALSSGSHQRPHLLISSPCGGGRESHMNLGWTNTQLLTARYHGKCLMWIISLYSHSKSPMEMKSFSSSYREESKALSDYKLAQGYRDDLEEAGIWTQVCFTWTLSMLFLCEFSELKTCRIFFLIALDIRGGRELTQIKLVPETLQRQNLSWTWRGDQPVHQVGAGAESWWWAE